MNIQPIPTDRIEAEWGSIVDALIPALRQDPSFRIQGLYDRLMDGSAIIFEAVEGGFGYWVITLDMDGDKLVAWTTALVGKIDGGPKQRLSVIRNAVDSLERTLKGAGVTAHRICGRDWHRVLPDYSPLDSARNGLQKRL